MAPDRGESARRDATPLPGGVRPQDDKLSLEKLSLGRLHDDASDAEVVPINKRGTSPVYNGPSESEDIRKWDDELGL